MAVIAPAPGIIWAATPSSSSSFAYSQRPLAFSRVSLRSSFLGSNEVRWKPIGMRSTLADRCKCHGLGGGPQMNLFSRVARIIKSYASSIISIFEDPEKILEQTVLDMNEDLKKMQLAVSQVLASQKQIETMYKSAQQTSEEWYKKAKLALNEGNEDLASEALNRHKFYADNASIWKAQLDQQNATVNTIISKTNFLKIKIEEAKSKKDDLKARAQSVKIAAHLRAVLGDVNPSGSLATFGRIEEKVWAMEAHEQALNQLATDDLVGKFALLESHSVDDALARLKKESSKSSKAEQKWELPPGRSTIAAGNAMQSSKKNNKEKRRHSESQIEEALNELTKAM